jgi:hypothetical protein
VYDFHKITKNGKYQQQNLKYNLYMRVLWQIRANFTFASALFVIEKQLLCKK